MNATSTPTIFLSPARPSFVSPPCFSSSPRHTHHPYNNHILATSVSSSPCPPYPYAAGPTPTSYSANWTAPLPKFFLSIIQPWPSQQSQRRYSPYATFLWSPYATNYRDSLETAILSNTGTSSTWAITSLGYIVSPPYFMNSTCSPRPTNAMFLHPFFLLK